MGRRFPWVLVAVLAAGMVVLGVLEWSASSDRDDKAAKLDASQQALAAKQAELKRVSGELQRVTSALARNRAALLRDQRSALMFMQGPDVVAASPEGRLTQTLVSPDDLRTEVFGRRVKISSLWETCERGGVLSVQTDIGGVADLYEDGRLKQADGNCPPVTVGDTTVDLGDPEYAQRGNEKKRLFPSGVDDTNRAWVTLSPDVQRVVFEFWADTVPPGYTVQLMHTWTHQQRALAPSLPEHWTKEAFAWSPNGNRIALMLRPPDPDNADLLAPAEVHPAWLRGAREAVAIIDRRGRVLARIPDAAHPVWSPDGRSIAFDSTRSGSRQIYVANADGTGVRQVTHGVAAAMPLWR